LNRIDALGLFVEGFLAVAAAIKAAAAECCKDAGDEEHEHESGPECGGIRTEVGFELLRVEVWFE